MKDIARAVGVSVVTVSRAFNNKPDIDAQTKERILNTAREMNYWPNILAKSLRDKKTKSIGVVIPDMSDPFYAEILQGCSNSARRHNYQIILTVLSQRGCDVDEELDALRTLIGKRVDGLLLQPEQEDIRYIEALKRSPIPVVFWNRQPRGLEGCFVSNNHEYGSYLAANHLIEKGHNEIFYLIRFPETGSVVARIAGCKRAVQEHGLAESAIHLIECGDSAEDAYNTTMELLQSTKKLTAIYTWDDVMAIGTVKAVIDKGYKIPQNIAIIGYNDIEIAAYFSPPLTTVHQKTIEIGEMATDILIKKIVGKDENNCQNILIEPELIIRQTT